MSRLDGAAEAYNLWAPKALAASPAVQEGDLDWGDIRDIKLTYVSESGWQGSAAWRYGRTNGSFRGAAYEEVPGGINVATMQYIQRNNHAITAVRDGERYEVADFMVGKDIGIGALGEGTRSVISAGVRYATFESASHVGMDGITESFVDPVLRSGLFPPKYGVEHWNHYLTQLDSTRTFEGMGPVLSWESAIRLAGDDHGGHADLDWKVGAAVLFGKQANNSFEDRFGEYFHQFALGVVPEGNFQTSIYDDDEPIPRSRKDEVTVPNVSLSLGLSYSIDRVKVSTGYSYDRFFDVIDGGFDEPKQYDRTIQGPYFKLSLGFGG